MHKLAEKLSNGNICIGNFYQKWYGTSPTYISYGAVEESKKVKRQSKDKNLITFLGRLEDETGIMEYLKAFKDISREFINLKLVVLGDGSQRQFAEEFVKKHKLKVEFKGFIRNTDEFIQRTNYMFTSRYLGILESLVNKKYTCRSPFF